jgi:hypothetical protein
VGIEQPNDDAPQPSDDRDDVTDAPRHFAIHSLMVPSLPLAPHTFAGLGYAQSQGLRWPRTARLGIDTVPLWLATYRRVPLGLTATLCSTPIGMALAHPDLAHGTHGSRQVCVRAVGQARRFQSPLSAPLAFKVDP